MLHNELQSKAMLLYTLRVYYNNILGFLTVFEASLVVYSTDDEASVSYST